MCNVKDRFVNPSQKVCHLMINAIKNKYNKPEKSINMICTDFKSQMWKWKFAAPNTCGSEPLGLIQSPGQPRICRGTLSWNKSKNKWQERVNLPQKVSIQQRLTEEDLCGILFQIEERIYFKVWIREVTEKVE